MPYQLLMEYAITVEEKVIEQTNAPSQGATGRIKEDNAFEANATTVAK